jgi:hypothetical protein
MECLKTVFLNPTKIVQIVPVFLRAVPNIFKPDKKNCLKFLILFQYLQNKPLLFQYSKIFQYFFINLISKSFFFSILYFYAITKMCISILNLSKNLLPQFKINKYISGYSLNNPYLL